MDFNIAVDTVIHHWLMIVAVTEAGMDGFSTSVNDLAVYFYAYDGLITPTKPERLQRLSSVLENISNGLASGIICRRM